MRSFGTFVKKSSSSDENFVLRSDESGRSRLVSEALQSSWVQRLRSGGHRLKRRETQNPKPCAGIWSRIFDGRIGSGFNVNPNKDPSGFLLQSSGALLLEDKIEDADIEKESDSAIHAHFLPKDSTFIDISKENQSPRASVYREDPGTETRMIASFGPFQVRATSLILPKPSVLDVSGPSTTFMGKPTLASVLWKQYFLGIRKEEPFDQRPTRVLSGTSGLDIKSRTENVDGERKEFRGGLLGSAPVYSYSYLDREYRAMVKYCGKKRDPHWKANQATGDNGRSSQLQRQAESQQPGSMGQNAGLYNEVMPLTGDGDVHGNGMVMDGTSSKRCKITFPNAVQRIMSEIESDGSVHCAQPSSLPSLIPHFTVSKQLLQTENCDNHHFVGQHSIRKQGSESLPMIKAHQLENPTGKHCTGPYNLTLALGPSMFGSAQELGTFNTMERLPAYSPIYPIFGNQKDDMIPTDNSCSTASLPQEIYANVCNRTANQTNSSECHVCQAKTASAIKGIDACYYRPRRDPDFLEPTSNSHFSNCQWRYQEETPAGAENRHLNQLEMARHSMSDAKGKGPSIPRISWEQWHDRKHIASSKGVASHYRSDDDVIHRTFQEKYAGPFYHCSNSRSIFQSVAPAVQAVALSVPTKECQETVTVRDGHKKGNSNKNKKFSAVDQTVLQANKSPTGHAGDCYYEINCDSCEYCHPKSRKQSTEARPASQRVLISSNERESKSDSDKYARLTISAVDGHTLSSGKRTHCTLQDDLALAPAIASKAVTMREVNASDDHRPQMWLQRWIHSGGSADLLRREVSRENTNCNLVTDVGSIARSSFGGWSGNNRKDDIVQWTNGRRKGSIDHFSDRNSQAWRKRYFDSKLKGNQLLKNVFTSSASAMAIMGTRDKEKYVAQPPRKRHISSFMTSNDLESKPTKNAFDQRTAEHKDAHI